MIKYIYLIVMVAVTLILIQNVSAIDDDYIFKQSEPAVLRIKCYFNSTITPYCNSSVSCNLTVTSPNSTLIVENEPMEHNPSSFGYNFSQGELSDVGTYQVDGVCVSSNSIPFHFPFEVNYAGYRLSSGQALLYIIFFVMSVFLFVLTIYANSRIQWRNQRDYGGNVVSINNLKGLKIALYYAIYIEMLWMLFLLSGIARNYLQLSGFTNFFYIGYIIFLVCLTPMTICAILFGFMAFIDDKKKHDAIKRGIPIK